MSTVQVRLAGLGSVLPAGSVARTVNVCEPSARPLYVWGEVHAVSAPPSSVQPKVEPVSVALKAKVADAEADVPDGPVSIVVSGARVVDRDRAAGRGRAVAGRVDGDRGDRRRTIGQARRIPARGVREVGRVGADDDIVDEEVDMVDGGVILGSGTDRDAAADGRPVGRRCERHGRRGRVGDLQVDRPGPAGRARVGVAGRVGRPDGERVRALGQAAVRLWARCTPSAAPPSSVQPKVEPVSVALKAKVAVSEVAMPDGPASIVVSGGVVSTVQVRLAGVGSVLPAGSVARTVNVCEPSARPLYVWGEVHAVSAPPSSVQPKVEPVSVALKAKVADAEPTVPGRPRVDRRVGRRRVDRPGPAGRARVGVAGRVGRPGR